MDERERKIFTRLRDDFEHYAAKCLKIRSKSGEIKPFILNKAQRHLHKIVEQQRKSFGRVRIIGLKGRQQGFSTYVEGRFYWRVSHRQGVRAFILTHEEDATKNLFEMAKRYHDNCHDLVKPQIEASNAKELVFGKLDSGYRLGTAGNKSVGRSSTIQYLHGSECAYWPNATEHAKGVMQAVPGEAETEIILESTANGLGNYFHQQWQLAERGESDFIAVFIPWFWQDEYAREIPENFSLTDDEEALIERYALSHEQIVWRRAKIMDLSVGGNDGLKSFMQEYPNNPAEAFQISGENTFIDPDKVMEARNNKREGVGPLLLGVDPARFGNDRFSMIYRQGGVAFGKQSYVKKDTMEIAGIVHREIIAKDPDKIFVDVVGLGAGVYDRLVELAAEFGYADKMVAVNGGSIPFEPDKYINKRAENWGLMREWIYDRAQIPDDDALHADLCGIKYKFDSKSRLVMEKKEEMKKRGLMSPDDADALAITFALPVNAFFKKSDNIAKRLMSHTNRVNNLKAQRKW